MFQRDVCKASNSLCSEGLLTETKLLVCSTGILDLHRWMFKWLSQTRTNQMCILNNYFAPNRTPFMCKEIFILVCNQIVSLLCHPISQYKHGFYSRIRHKPLKTWLKKNLHLQIHGKGGPRNRFLVKTCLKEDRIHRVSPCNVFPLPSQTKCCSWS